MTKHSAQLDALSWKREGYGAWIEPETWVLRNVVGAVYAKVRRDEHAWTWYTAQATGAGFKNREQAQSMAAGYVRTHPNLPELNR